MSAKTALIPEKALMTCFSAAIHGSVAGATAGWVAVAGGGVSSIVPGSDAVAEGGLTVVMGDADGMDSGSASVDADLSGPAASPAIDPDLGVDLATGKSEIFFNSLLRVSILADKDLTRFFSDANSFWYPMDSFFRAFISACNSLRSAVLVF